MHTAVGQSSGRRREEGARTCALAMEEVRGRCEQRAGKRSDGVACTCGRGHPRRRCCPAVLGGSSYDSSSSSKSAASSSASSGSLPLAMAAAARRHNGRGAEVATRTPKGPSAPARGSSSALSLKFRSTEELRSVRTDGTAYHGPCCDPSLSTLPAHCPSPAYIASSPLNLFVRRHRGRVGHTCMRARAAKQE